MALGKTKRRICKNCKEFFTPKYNPMQSCCTIECGIAWARGKPERDALKEKNARQKQRNIEKREFKEGDRKLQIKLCQQAVNWHVKYVLQKDKPCYTCDKPLSVSKGTHCGHWLTVGAHPEKRFDTLHLRRQCYKCNCKNGGRPDVFEKKLRAELGDEVVDEFVSSKPPKLTTAEVVELKKRYLRLNREAKKAMRDD